MIRSVFLALLITLVSTAAAETGSLRMAVTVDDLPAVGTDLGLDVQRVITDDIVSALRSFRVPAIGFVNEKKLYEEGQLVDERVDLLRQWVNAELELGNHSYSHPDLHETTLEEYFADVTRGDKVTGEVLAAVARRPRYFRHPFLHTGRDIATARRAAAPAGGSRVSRRARDDRQRRVGLCARAYDRLVDAGEDEAAAKLAEQYVDYMEQVVRYYEAQSGRVSRISPASGLVDSRQSTECNRVGSAARKTERSGIPIHRIGRGAARPGVRPAG